MSHVPQFSADPALNAALAPLTGPPGLPVKEKPPRAPKEPEKSPAPPVPVLEWDPVPRTKQEALDQLARARRRAERLFAFAVVNARCSACTAHQAAAREIVLRLSGRRI